MSYLLGRVLLGVLTMIVSAPKSHLSPCFSFGVLDRVEILTYHRFCRSLST